MTTGIGDMQLVGLRQFGQVHAQLAGDNWQVTVFASPDDRGLASLEQDSTVTDAGEMVPGQTLPPNWGGTGFGDLVKCTLGVPSTYTPNTWSNRSRVAINLLYSEHTESGTKYWLLMDIESQAFFWALTDEVELLISA